MKPSDIEITVACEESQAVTIAFRQLGFIATSCDLQPCSGGHPEWHVQDDIRNYMAKKKAAAVVAHPTCTEMANSGVRWFASTDPRDGYEWSEKYGVYLIADPAKWQRLEEGCEFFNYFVDYGKAGNNIMIENPIHHRYAKERVREQDQIIQPWEHGHKKMKATCLWQYGLPLLEKSNVVGPPPKDRELRKSWQDVWLASPGPNRAKLRSKTYPGIAKAIAKQYGDYLLKTL